MCSVYPTLKQLKTEKCRKEHFNCFSKYIRKGCFHTRLVHCYSFALFLLYMPVERHVHMPQHTCGFPRTPCRSQFSLSTTRHPVIPLGSSGLGRGAITLSSCQGLYLLLIPGPSCPSPSFSSSVPHLHSGLLYSIRIHLFLV